MSPRTLLPSKYSYDSNLADVKFDSVFPSLCIETAIVTAGPVFPKDQNFESPWDSLTLKFGGPRTPVPKILRVLFKFTFFAC